VKLGAENRTKLISAIVLMAVAVVLLLRFLFSGGSATPVVASTPVASSASAPVSSPAAPRGRILAKGSRKAAAPERSLDPTLRYDWLKQSEDTKYEGSGRNIFRAEVEIPKPVAPVITQPKEVAQAPQGPPPPPPINLKFFGFASHPGEPKKVFLSQGEDIFVAREGDIIDRRYRVLHIMPNAVEIEDVLYNNRQSIPLTQG
jgi:hypothetical protein